MSSNILVLTSPVCPARTACVPTPPTGKDVVSKCPTPDCNTSSDNPWYIGRYTLILGILIYAIASPIFKTFK